MEISNENKKEIFFKNEVIKLKKTQKFSRNGTLMRKEHKLLLTNTFFAELEDRNTKEITFYSNQSIDNLFKMRNGEIFQTKDLKKIDFDNTDIRIYKLSVEDIKQVADDMAHTFLSTKSNVERELKLEKLLKSAFENPEIIEINKDKSEKANNFENSLKKFENALKDYSKEYSSTFEKINGEEQYSITFNPNTIKSNVIVAKDLKSFRDNIVDFLKDKINSELLNEFKETNLENLQPETDKNFKFTFENSKSKSQYSLTVETDEKIYMLKNKKNLKDISLNLVDKDYSKLLSSFDEIPNYKKLDFLKDENKDLFKKLDENIKTETLEDIRNDISYRAIVNTKLKNDVIGKDNNEIYDNNRIFSDIKEEIEKLYEIRIDNLKDEEKITLVERSNDILGLSLNSQGKVEELYSENENKYLDNVNELLATEKEKTYEDFVENFEKIKEKKVISNIFSKDKSNKKENDINYNIQTLDYLTVETALNLNEETLDIQEKIFENSILLLTSTKFDEEKEITKFQYGEQTKEVKDLKKEIYNEFREYYKKNTETLKDMTSEKIFQSAFSSLATIDFYDFNKEKKVELTKFSDKETKNKEVEKGNEKEIDL